MLASLRGHHPGGGGATDSTSDLAVRRRKVLVPEECHLFLKRTPRVDHPE
jgi:hypothetical protein